ncbi:MAG: serine/threonine protein kinase [Phycisphaerae bacterium]|nr:serine/threonine protein kinase [Phycisphaerae bacterium]
MAKKKQRVFESVFNTYRYSGEVGSGGSGIVVKVEDEDENTFALKYLNPDRITSDKLKRFKNELSFCENNEHANIIKVIDRGYTETEDVKCPFYVMPYYPETLRRLMKTGISPTDVLPFFSLILDGIEAAHFRDIWHRDIKPENILSDPAANALVIADFGIAHFEEEFLHTAVATRQQDRLANFQYAAPEQRGPGEQVDRRADIYALGMILNEMFTGKLPQGTKFQKVGDVSPDHAYLDSLIDLMLHQNPDHRPQDIDAIKKELIAHKSAFVSQQRLSQLQTVVPKYESDDPLVNNPVSVVSLDIQGGKLIFKLSQKVNQDWINIFWKQNTADGSKVMMHSETNIFDFDEDQATHSVEEQNAQRIVDYFKSYLELANQGYKKFIEKKQRRKERQERERLEAEIAQEKRRQRILGNLKI